MTGGDSLGIDEKFKSAFSAAISAKPVIATNAMPALADGTGAFIRRIVWLQFPNVAEEPDPFLDKKLAQELDGIFNWAVKGLCRLMAEKDFLRRFRGSAQLPAEVHN
jgi:putative DNA primase/helicase